METEPFKQTQKEEQMHAFGSFGASYLPELSFIPSELLKKTYGARERCALVGIILGTTAVVSWIVILFGVVYSIIGIIFSVIGLKSTRKKWARIGLGLSVIGLVLSIWHIVAVYQGTINYNYFTSEFWGR